MEDKILIFPKKFLWGVGSSAYQFEGHSSNNDWSLWEELAKKSSYQKSGDACNWWNNTEKDFDLATSVGINALKMSIEWSRVEVSDGEWDTKAIERYREIIVALKDRGIEPVVGLHHFSSPIWFIRMGGWESQKSVYYFSRYARKIIEEFGDLVNLWWTINEPSAYAYVGYGNGSFPPNKKSFNLGFVALKNLLLAHFSVCDSIHQLFPDAQVGLPHAYRAVAPNNPSSLFDRFAANIRYSLANSPVISAISNGTLKFPLTLFRMIYEPPIKTDWIGVNYYTLEKAAFDITKPKQLFTRIIPPEHHPPGYPDHFGHINPQTLRKITNQLAAFKKPIYITENGYPENSDAYRPEYILKHLAAVYHSIQDGVNIKGYFYWSFLDCFEWLQGYGIKFGLIDVDVNTQIRKIKASGDLYREIIRDNGIKQSTVMKYAPNIVNELFPNHEQM